MIAEKILNVMRKIEPVIKDKTNEEKNFDYASLASIILQVREAMIEEKIIMVCHEVKQVVQRQNDVIISMIYRFWDTEKNDKKENEYIEVNILGEGYDKDGWAIYKALSGAYKYALTQTFAIPTVDDAEKSSGKNTTNGNEEENIINGNSLNENKIDEILGNPEISDYDNIFSLGENVG